DGGGAGHRREGAVFRRAIGDLASARAQRRGEIDRFAENGGDVRAPEHRRITGRLVIATHNPGKLAEMRELLAPYKIEAISAGEMGLREPDESGTSFRANARIQANAAAKAAG